MFKNEYNLILAGVIHTAPEFSHKSHDLNFVKFKLGIERLSGVTDCITVLAKEELVDSLNIRQGDFIKINGELRSFNNKSGIGNRLIITAFAYEINPCVKEYQNEIHLSGTLCKDAISRKTPLGREICDLMLAVNRKYNRTDYIPCILWGSNAIRASVLTTGCDISIRGRIQSREYIKTIGDISETKTTYEVSAAELVLP